VKGRLLWSSGSPPAACGYREKVRRKGWDERRKNGTGQAILKSHKNEEWMASNKVVYQTPGLITHICNLLYYTT